MTRAERAVAREIAGCLRVGSLPDKADLQRWLLLLAPPVERRVSRISERRARRRDLDALCREIVFARDRATCRRCGRTEGKLDLSHVFPKGSHPWLRWDLDNVKVLCAVPCHLIWWHGHPEEAMRWWEEQIGPSAMHALRMRAARPSKTDAAAVRLYLEAEQRRFGA